MKYAAAVRPIYSGKKNVCHICQTRTRLTSFSSQCHPHNLVYCSCQMLNFYVSSTHSITSGIKHPSDAALKFLRSTDNPYSNISSTVSIPSASVCSDLDRNYVLVQFFQLNTTYGCNFENKQNINDVSIEKRHSDCGNTAAKQIYPSYSYQYVLPLSEISTEIEKNLDFLTSTHVIYDYETVKAGWYRDALQSFHDWFDDDFLINPRDQSTILLLSHKIKRIYNVIPLLYVHSSKEAKTIYPWDGDGNSPLLDWKDNDMSADVNRITHLTKLILKAHGFQNGSEEEVNVKSHLNSNHNAVNRVTNEFALWPERRNKAYRSVPSQNAIIQTGNSSVMIQIMRIASTNSLELFVKQYIIQLCDLDRETEIVLHALSHLVQPMHINDKVRIDQYTTYLDYLNRWMIKWSHCEVDPDYSCRITCVNIQRIFQILPIHDSTTRINRHGVVVDEEDAKKHIVLDKCFDWISRDRPSGTKIQSDTGIESTSSGTDQKCIRTYQEKSEEEEISI